MRAVYLPEVWGHRISAIDGTSGSFKEGEIVSYDIAGPLCFQVSFTNIDLDQNMSLLTYLKGDFLAKDVNLPKLQKGDVLVIHDTGGYDFKTVH